MFDPARWGERLEELRDAGGMDTKRRALYGLTRADLVVCSVAQKIDDLLCAQAFFHAVCYTEAICLEREEQVKHKGS